MLEETSGTEVKFAANDSRLTIKQRQIYADNLRQAEPRTESRAVRALITTGGTQTMKSHDFYVEVYAPNQVMLKMNGIIIYSKTNVTTDNDHIGQIYLGQKELKVRRMGHDVMMNKMLYKMVTKHI